MKKNKGFTLVELLAVFVILAIIASIVLFSINNIKKNSARSVYIESVKNLITSTRQYYGENNYTDFPSEGIDIKELKIDNKKQFTSGIVKLVNDDFIVVDVSNGEYCANGKIDNLIVTDGECS
jgi:type IV pilus assembly protein PilA